MCGWSNNRTTKGNVKNAYLEHCYVATMNMHDNLNPETISNSIKEIGSKKCIMATDFGQIHNPHPVNGMKMFIDSMLQLGIKKTVLKRCIQNPSKLFLK